MLFISIFSVFLSSFFLSIYLHARFILLPLIYFACSKESDDKKITELQPTIHAKQCIESSQKLFDEMRSRHVHILTHCVCARALRFRHIVCLSVCMCFDYRLLSCSHTLSFPLSVVLKYLITLELDVILLKSALFILKCFFSRLFPFQSVFVLVLLLHICIHERVIGELHWTNN